MDFLHCALTDYGVSSCLIPVRLPQVEGGVLIIENDIFYRIFEKSDNLSEEEYEQMMLTILSGEQEALIPDSLVNLLENLFLSDSIIASEEHYIDGYMEQYFTLDTILNHYKNNQPIPEDKARVMAFHLFKRRYLMELDENTGAYVLTQCKYYCDD